MDSKTTYWIGLSLGFLGLLCLFNVYSLLYSIGSVPFSQDDLQHTHVAWNVYRGKVIFKDFHEHHGPLFAWWNALLLKLKWGAVESVFTLNYLRTFSVIVALLTAMVLGVTVSSFSPTPLLKFVCGFAASSLFLSLRSIQTAGFNARPDIYVGFFSLLFLLYWIKNHRLKAGIYLGLALGFHPKFLPINLGFLVADALICWKRKTAKDFGRLLLGQSIPLLFMIGFLALQGALLPALQSMFSMNLNLISKRVTDKSEIIADLFLKFLKLDPALLVLVIGSWTGLLLFYLTKKSEKPLERLFFLLIALTGGLFLLSPIHEYALLLVIPLFLTFLFYFALSCLPAKWTPYFLGLICCLCLGTVIGGEFQKSKRQEQDFSRTRRSQEDILSFTLVNLKRTDPIFYVWFSRCPAYVFNEDSAPQWMRSGRSIEEDETILPGFPVSSDTTKKNRQSTRNRFIEERVRCVAIDDMFRNHLNPVERSYLEQNFRRDGCLWIRN